MKKAVFIIATVLLLMAGYGVNAQTHDGFERSYWIDIDLHNNNSRGYWKPIDSMTVNSVPSRRDIANSCRLLAWDYGANKLYVVYHRQFEFNEFKATLLLWNKYGKLNGLQIVPTFVLESYATPATMNFSNKEIREIALWCLEAINDKELGIYDVYIRQQDGSSQDMQMAALKNAIGNKLVRVGLQPGEPLSQYCASGVEDTWTAECQGQNNELWSNPKEFKGTDIYGKKLLDSWVAERVSGESRCIVWDMIPVAWDYEKPLDAFGYTCPGDDALINDAPIHGRIALCHQAIESAYPQGMLNLKFGGYSCDLHILNANSVGKPDAESFYQSLCAGKTYKGYFASALEQISALYKTIKKQ